MKNKRFIFNLFIGALLIFCFALTVNANDKYELKEIELSEKNKIVNIIKLNDKKDGFLATGERYQIAKPENYTGDKMLNPDDAYGNVYNISFDGTVTKANLYYEDDSYEFFYIGEDNKLVKKMASSSGFYDPVFSKPLKTINEGNIDGVDETLLFLTMLCPNIYMENDDHEHPEYNFQDNTSSQNFVCVVNATNESSEQLLFGLVMQGPGAKVVLKPSSGYEKSLIFDDKVMLKKENNAGYVVVSNDGVIGEFDDTLINKIKDTYDEEVEIDPLGISVISYKGKLLYEVNVGLPEETGNKVYVYDNKIIGKYTADTEVFKMKNEFLIIEDSIADKLYTFDGNILADTVNYKGYNDGYEVINYIKDNKINFFNEKDIIYQLNYDKDKYNYLFSYQFSYDGNYVFLNGDISVNGYRDKITILKKVVQEEQAEEKTAEVEKTICKRVGDTFYDKDGNVVSKVDYEKSCPEPVPNTGIIIPMFSSAILISIFIVIKSRKGKLSKI